MQKFPRPRLFSPWFPLHRRAENQKKKKKPFFLISLFLRLLVLRQLPVYNDEQPAIPIIAGAATGATRT
jgi:hypothetical protein